MYFLNPTYLWALLGLIIPLAIHLWSKKEGKTIKIGSVKLLKESNSKQSSSIQFNEWWLFLLRMLLIGLLVLIISQPQIKRKTDQVPITYIIEPSLLSSNKITRLLDTLTDVTSVKLLRKGFPEFNNDQLSGVDTIVPKYWQLIKEMETLPTDSIVVMTKAYLSGIQGRRPEIQKNISLITLDLGVPTKDIVQASKKEEEIELISVNSNYQALSFEKKNLSSTNDQFIFNSKKDSVSFLMKGKKKRLSVFVEKPKKILLYYQDSLFNQKNYMEASFRAIEKYTNIPFQISSGQRIDTLDLDTFDLLVWLSKDTIPKTSKKRLAYQLDNFAAKIIEPGTSSNTFYLTRSLNIENMMNEYFLEQLIDVLDLHKNIKRKIPKYDKRTVSLEELTPITIDNKRSKKSAVFFDVSNWMWLLFMVFLIVERILSKLRKQ
ncbi:BatA domain-containing protein [Aquimarina sp. 2201CG5-10]|uniref:BatA domain-containing protein n=1 Tax=Aquimarina callyspongiae TaxID=3098150 RepID=UPI002AB5077A|nr:BatA domain-containing protein [Aquimarina sp. 2201CG5-10]MDY8137974.1 BatA domain-containing protein [Aquimarina sp. 2201CG5-10]